MTSKKKSEKKPEEEEEKTSGQDSPTKDAEPVTETTMPPTSPSYVPPPQSPQTRFEAFGYPLRVLVSPLKAFQRIAAYPDLRGLLLVIVLLIAAAAGLQFTVSSKIQLMGTSLVDTSFFESVLVSGVVQSFSIFIISWLIFAAALLLLSSLLGAKGGSWSQLFIIIGYALSVFVLRTVVSALLILTLPPINFNLSAWPPTTETDITNVNNQIAADWGPLPGFQVGGYINLIFDAWLVILGAVAMRAYKGVTWSRAAIIAVTAYLIYFTLRLFIGF